MVGCKEVLFQAQNMDSRDGTVVDIICGNTKDGMTKEILFCHKCQKKANTQNSKKENKDIELMGYHFTKNPPKGCEITEVTKREKKK